MKVKKTIQGGVVNLTKVKEKVLKGEYNKLQELLKLKKNGLEFLPLYNKIKSRLYSANVQQAERYYKRLNGKEYPISIRKDLIDIEKCESDVCDYFVKIPVKGRYGGLKVPVNTHQEIKEDWEIRESKLYKRDGRFYINITVHTEVSQKQKYKGVLAFDLGIRHFAVSVALPSQDVHFRGKEIKQIRRKYFYFRRRTNHLQTIQRWGQREENRINDILHKMTTEIVEYAEEHKLLIVVGDLKGLRNQTKNKAKRYNRKLNSFSFHKFKRYLKYKAEWKGIKVAEVSEAYTSQICHKCGQKGKRNKGLFECNGTEINSDVNGAWNVAKRALGKPEIRSMLGAGASVAMPESGVDDGTSGTGNGDKFLSEPETLERLEAPSFR